MAAFDAGPSAAKRRRERRLRSWWRHERMSITAVLATVSHHSYPKVDTKYDAPRGQKTVTTCRVLRILLGERPAALLEPWPQGMVQRHSGIGYELVQALDAPVPQTVEQLPDVLQFFDTLTTDPEQVIEVPKILPEDVPVRAVLRDPQLAEQLVEVPTIVSYSWLQLRLEQNVDIPVPGRGGRFAGLQSFLPGQSSTALLGTHF